MNEIYKVLTCGHCSREVQLLMSRVNVVAKITYQDSMDAFRIASRLPTDLSGLVYAGACPFCARTTVIEARAGVSLSGTETLGDIEQYPPPLNSNAPEMWPENLRTAWNDVVKMQRSDVSAPTLSTAVGTCLQLALRLLGASGKSMHSEIEDLRQKGVITASLADWANDLRGQRNKGTHDFLGNPEDAAEAVEFLRLFLQLTFTLRAQIDIKRMKDTPSV